MKTVYIVENEWFDGGETHIEQKKYKNIKLAKKAVQKLVEEARESLRKIFPNEIIVETTSKEENYEEYDLYVENDNEEQYDIISITKIKED